MQALFPRLSRARSADGCGSGGGGGTLYCALLSKGRYWSRYNKGLTMFGIVRIQLIRKFIALITVVNQESFSFFETLSGYIFLLF